MTARMFGIGLLVVAGFLLAAPVRAGLYSTADAAEETRLSLDYERVFRSILGALRTISVPQPERDPPMRRRYVLMEKLGQKGVLSLDTLEQKLNYSVVLIRRGKADEAVQLLVPLTEKHPKNFVVFSHCATAYFLASNPDLRANAVEYMKEAMSLWPERWDQVDEEQKAFLTSIGWEETAFARNRKYETYLQRLMRNRHTEASLVRRKKTVPETVDPIFVDDQKPPVPVRFVNETGEFEVGRIALAEKAKLPEDAVEAVEQLLVWLPHDKRLLWLLGEVFNASASKYTAADARQKALRYQAIKDSYLIFAELTHPLDRMNYAVKEVKDRFEKVQAVFHGMEDPRALDPGVLGLDTDDKDPSILTNEQWQRTLLVGFITGFAVGVFVLWQFQEVRRRRQARHALRHISEGLP